MSPDLVARQVIVSCYLYYNLSSPIITDHEYEHLVKLVVNNWDDIHPDRKWALGSPEALSATGNGIKVSLQAIMSARRAWCRYHNLTDKDGPWPYHGEGVLKFSKKRQTHYIIARD